uniref:Uncharacterized protein n=1 Tax=Euplotes crassus TaxID=5936 RepID=A0A7S3KMW6_EUPCR|mmetsp:Transcript_33869/g.33404  ORF Transcript_33869/g.33404 Transcript_33869/m.33404 type:complete len:140 (+) Transcript_33869:584-1003(+)
MEINDEEHTNICRYLSDLTNTSDGMSYTIVPDGQKLSSHNFSETSAKDFHYKGSSSKDFQKRHSTYKLNCQYFTTMKINETGEELRSLRSFKTIPECIEYLLKDKFSLLDRAVRGIEVQLDQEDVGDFFSSSTLAMLAI